MPDAIWFCLISVSDSFVFSAQKSEATFKLARLRAATDNALDKIDVWLGKASDGEDMQQKHDFRLALNLFRVSIELQQTDCNRVVM